jgi:hypothetical protein
MEKHRLQIKFTLLNSFSRQISLFQKKQFWREKIYFAKSEFYFAKEQGPL